MLRAASRAPAGRSGAGSCRDPQASEPCTIAALLPCVYHCKAASRPLVLRRYTQGSLCTLPALLRWHTPGECTVYHPQPGKEGVPRLVETGSSACASGAVIGGDNTVDWRDELGDAEGLAALSSTATLDTESFYPQKQVSPTPDP